MISAADATLCLHLDAQDAQLTHRVEALRLGRQPRITHTPPLSPSRHLSWRRIHGAPQLRTS